MNTVRALALLFVLFIICALIAYFIGLLASVANAAEPQGTIIEYTSAEDLTAQVAEVIGVCDTTWADTTSGQIAYYGKDDYRVGFYTEFDAEINGKMRFITQTNLLDDKLETRCISPLITCRKLICSQIYSWPRKDTTWITGAMKGKRMIKYVEDISGQAIVWWEEVKR